MKKLKQPLESSYVPKVKKILIQSWPFLLFLLVFTALFYKVFFLKLVPFPGDLLVSWFFPYKSGGWEGYSPWITHKAFIGADVVRQLYVWRVLAMDLLKQGIIPLWNPYEMAGSVLMANMQTAAFYPLNILFFIFENRYAWVIYILIQPIMSFWFMYLFIRSLKLHRFAAFLTALAFPFIGLMTMQFVWGTVVHVISWLPLILYGVQQYRNTRSERFLIISAIALSFSILGGYIQPVVYILIITFIYFLCCFFTEYKEKGRRSLYFLKTIWIFFIGIGLGAVQLIPLYESYTQSARDSFMEKIFHVFQFPYQHLLTFFASDFFGNSATKNYWGIGEYSENMTFIGIVVLFFAVVGIVYKKDTPLVRWLFITGIIAMLFALPTPFSEILIRLKIMVLSTGVPARAMFITQFCFLVISAFGLDYFFTERKKLPLIPIILLTVCYIFLWVFVLVAPTLVKNSDFSMYMAIAKRNLLLPSVTFGVVLLSIGIHRFVKKSWIVFLFLVVFATFEYQYFMYKYTPFSPMEYMFPAHPLVTYLQKITKYDRVYGYDTAMFGTNVPTQWRLQLPEGYDSTTPKRYSELIFATHDGVLHREVPRSDVYFENSLPKDENYPKQVVMNLLGIKYVIDKDDAAPAEWDPRYDRFPKDRYDLIWQMNKWKVYTNKNALPRALFFTDFVVKENDEAIIQTLFAKDFPYREKIILEGNTSPFVPKQQSTPAKELSIDSYRPSEVKITVTTKERGFVFLSDMFYPGWKAYVDGKESKILRADYAFRAVPVEPGTHVVSFIYKPMSFLVGMIVTAVTFCILVGGILIHTVYRFI